MAKEHTEGYNVMKVLILVINIFKYVYTRLENQVWWKILN